MSRDLRSIFRHLLAGAALLVLATSGLALAGVDLPDEASDTARDQVADVESGEAPAAEDTDADDDAGTLSHENGGDGAGAANHEAAQAFAEGIRAWTDCIRENAAQPEDGSERAGGFDPKDGCEAPETTPGGQPFGHAEAGSTATAEDGGDGATTAGGDAEPGAAGHERSAEARAGHDAEGDAEGDTEVDAEVDTEGDAEGAED
jgi:hypothetical protein